METLNRFWKSEAGQALTEFGLMAPVLLLLLGGVVYCGVVVLTQEELAVAARHVARREALNATAKNLGSAVVPGGRDGALAEAIANRRGASMKGVNWGTLEREAAGPGDLSGHGYNATLVKQSKTLTGDGQKYKFGIGVAYHGVTVNKNLADFAPIAKIAGLPTIEVGSSSVMPRELPVRGKDSILELNPWIADIVNDKKVFKRRPR